MATGSPWIDGKAMATAAAAFLLAALAACGFVFEHGRRVEAAVAALAISVGVLWSNVLVYHAVWLAPRPQMAELASIGGRFAGDGPTLMTEYQPYGVRHFLRRLDPEGAGELRRRVVPLLNGQGVEKGGYADLDQFQLDGILVYRTLVLRRSPSESRPPSPYRLVSRGRYYDVWQRPDSYAPIVRHLGLGDAPQPGAVPPCSEVRQLAAAAGPSGLLAAAPRSESLVATFSNVARSAGFQTDAGGYLFPGRGAGTVALDVSVPSAGRYAFWLGGSFRDRLRLSVDGRRDRRRAPLPLRSGLRAAGRGAADGRDPPRGARVRRPRPASGKRRLPVRARPARAEPRRGRRARRVRAGEQRDLAVRPHARLGRGTRLIARSNRTCCARSPRASA